MHMVVLPVAGSKLGTEIGTDLLEDTPQYLDGAPADQMAAVLRHKDQVNVQSENARSPAPKVT